MKPRLLDLFCGAGGAAKGYRLAGFDVIGVDIAPQPRYAGARFVQADALDVLRLLVGGQDDRDEAFRVLGLETRGDGESFLAAVDGGLFNTVDADHVFHEGDSPKPASGVKGITAIHASPPCQSYSRALSHMAAPTPELIEPVRELLIEVGLPWIIENVVGAPLPSMWTLDGRYGLELCGTQFGLRIGWHRLFEASFPIDAPSRRCRCESIYVVNPHNQAGRDRIYAEFGPGDPEATWRRERGTEWMTRYEAREAIPPAYTLHIGRQVMAYLESEVEAAA